MNQENPHVLVPPRPNLGPEPWRESYSTTTLLVGAATLLAVALAAWWAWRRYRYWRRRRNKPALDVPAIHQDDSPAGKLLDLAAEVRGALITRFGPALRARTTEEIAADPEMREFLGDERLDLLIRLLAEADHWKFATRPENGRERSVLADLPAWDAWRGSLLADLAVKPRPRSPGGKKTSPSAR